VVETVNRDASEKIGAGHDQTEIVRYWEKATGVRL
jgi:hypothetical protein